MLQLHDLTKCLVFTQHLSTRFSSLLRAQQHSAVSTVNTHLMPFLHFAHCPHQPPLLVMILSNAQPMVPGVQCWVPPVITPQRDLGSLLLLYSTSHLGQSIFSKNILFCHEDPATRQSYFPRILPHNCILYVTFKDSFGH